MSKMIHKPPCLDQRIYEEKNFKAKLSIIVSESQIRTDSVAGTDGLMSNDGNSVMNKAIVTNLKL